MSAVLPFRPRSRRESKQDVEARQIAESQARNRARSPISSAIQDAAFAALDVELNEGRRSWLAIIAAGTGWNIERGAEDASQDEYDSLMPDITKEPLSCSCGPKDGPVALFKVCAWHRSRR